MALLPLVAVGGEVSRAQVLDALQTLFAAAPAFAADDVSADAVRGHLRQAQNLLIPDHAGPGSMRHRAQQTRTRYHFTCLLEALLTARLISNSSDLPEVFARSVHYLFGPEIAEQVQRELQSGEIKVPSEATLSRARLKLDVLSMMSQQERARALAAHDGNSGFFVMLSSDSSPQGGLDYQMTLQDKVSRLAAGDLMLAGSDPDSLEKWASSHSIETSQLPLAILASGNSGLPAKFEGLFHQEPRLHQSLFHISQSFIL